MLQALRFSNFQSPQFYVNWWGVTLGLHSRFGGGPAKVRGRGRAVGDLGALTSWKGSGRVMGAGGPGGGRSLMALVPGQLADRLGGNRLVPVTSAAGPI